MLIPKRITRRLRTAWILLTFLPGVLTTPAQSPCNLKFDQLTQAPELFGFHLGMTLEQVTVRVPQVRFPLADQLGVAKTTINPGFDSSFDQASFAGARTVSMDFLDGKLTTLWIGYNESFKWQKLDEFVAGVSRSLNLPAALSARGLGRELRCDGFSVFASMIAAAAAVVIGDTRMKLYYPNDCDEADKVPEANRVVFKDKDTAEKAGYKRAKDCP